MNDLGCLWYFLGMVISQGSLGVVLSQQKCASDIIDCVVLSDEKVVDTPI